MIVDFHTHVFPEWLRDGRERYVSRDATFGELYSDPRARMATAEDLVAAMDSDGVDVAVVMGLGWSDEGLARDVNDYIIDAVRRHPGRLVGFGGVSPAWRDAAAREADRCARAGLKGVGELHPDTQRFDMGDAAVTGPLMEAVRHHGLIVTAHSSEPVGHLYPGKGSNRPEALWRFIQSYPDATLVCAHWGGGLPFYSLMPEVGASLEKRLLRHGGVSAAVRGADLRGGGGADRGRADTAGQRLRPAASAQAVGAGQGVGAARGRPRRDPGRQRGAAAAAVGAATYKSSSGNDARCILTKASSIWDGSSAHTASRASRKPFNPIRCRRLPAARTRTLPAGPADPAASSGPVCRRG